MAVLFEELDLGKITIPNRYAVAPMGFVHDIDGGVSNEQKAYLAERAKGGFGIVYPSAHTVTTKYESPAFAGNFLCDYGQAVRLKEAVHQVHLYGAKFALQLTPGYGRVYFGFPGMPGCTHVSASDNPIFLYPDFKCHPLTKEEIQELVQCMGTAAGLAKAAGVDILEIHAYGGYLIDQFMTPMWNRRNDEYGGSLENRLRFFRECYEAVRAAVGPDYPISVKFTPDHNLPGGRTLEGEGIEICRVIDDMDFVYIHLDDGCYERWNKAIPSSYDEAGVLVKTAGKLREAGIKKPFMVQGKMVDSKAAEEAVASGVVQIIGLGKQSLADPYYPLKVKSGKEEDITYCMACCECLNGGQLETHPLGCAVNPRTAHELEYCPKKAANRKKLLVVGGGPGGMYAAKMAAELGHTVELWEKTDKLGGNLVAAGAADFKIDVRRYYENLAKQLYKSGAEVCLSKEADRTSVDEFAPDAVIIAAGAKPIIPGIKGIDGDNVLTANQVLIDNIPAGENVVVIGGGDVGCEAALFLQRQGKKVTVVEALDAILTAQDAMNNKMGIQELVTLSGMNILTSTTVTEITPEGVRAATGEGENFIPCDTVVVAVGYRSDRNLYDELKTGDYRLFTIGNYNKPGKVWFAVHDADEIVRNLENVL